MTKLIIVAHPDDEAIFFSSIVAECDYVIFVYGPCPWSKRLTNARMSLQTEYTVSNAIFMNESEEKIWLSDIIGPLRGFRYNISSRIEKIRNKILDTILDLGVSLENAEIFTHNEFGEYGNKEHMIVCNALKTLQTQYPFRLLHSNYVGRQFMTKQNLKKLASTSRLARYKNVNIQTYILMRQVYIDCKCWTWPLEYYPPATECFIITTPYNNNHVNMAVDYPLNLIDVSDSKLFSIRRSLSELKNWIFTILSKYKA